MDTGKSPVKSSLNLEWLSSTDEQIDYLVSADSRKEILDKLKHMRQTRVDIFEVVHGLSIPSTWKKSKVIFIH